MESGLTVPARIAFANDIDCADWAAYEAAHRELSEEFGIETEDSFWIFDPAGSEMALFGASLDEKGPRHDELLERIAAGRLTIMHTVGNFNRCDTDVRPTRQLMAEGLAYLQEHARVPAIWTNHGDEGNVQNIGWPGATYQEGDDPSSPAYVLDLLLQSGVRWFWTDRHTTNDFGNATAPGRDDSLVRAEPTRAGMTIQCFVRFRGALPKAPDAETLGQQITPRRLDQLASSGRAAVIYQHWCVHRDASGRPHTAQGPIFPPDSRAALRQLCQRRDAGAIEIVRLGQLLDDCARAA